MTFSDPIEILSVIDDLSSDISDDFIESDVENDGNKNEEGKTSFR